MKWDIAGLGNALIDALVVVDDDSLVDEFGLVRGTMHPVDHARWSEVYERIRLNKVTFDSGGSCANAVATAGYLGARATYCGQVGDDQMGRMYAQRMTEACGSHHLRFTQVAPTGKCLSIVSAKDAERTMLTDLGAAVLLPEIGPYVRELRSASMAHFTGYTLLDGPMRQIAVEAIHIASSAGAKISLDCADPFVVVQTRDLLWTLLGQYVDVAFLNADEARGLTEEEPELAVETIARVANVETVVVKLGSKGSLVHHAGETSHVDIVKVPAVDTTGAGDSYAGAFMYGLSRGFPVERCGRLASAVAARAVAQIGAVVKDRELLRRLVEESAEEPVRG
jgi:sugar/nucleoside kinase (ribokinase family)